MRAALKLNYLVDDQAKCVRYCSLYSKIYFFFTFVKYFFFQVKIPLVYKVVECCNNYATRSYGNEGHVQVNVGNLNFISSKFLLSFFSSDQQVDWIGVM